MRGVVIAIEDSPHEDISVSSTSTSPTMKHCTANCLMVLVVFATVGAISSAKYPIFQRLSRNNDLNINTRGRKLSMVPNTPLVYLQPPNVVRTKTGERVELNCAVKSSPPPTVQWVKGSNAAQQAELLESNDILEHFVTGVGATQSRLVFDCVTAEHAGLYTCVGTSNMDTALSTPTMLVVTDTRLSCPERLAESAPRIVQWTPYLLPRIGDDAIMTCRAVGYPTPSVKWVDMNNQNQTVTGSDAYSRFKILPNGDLLIMNVGWSQMGLYACEATNALGTDRETIFLYPAKKDS